MRPVLSISAVGFGFSQGLTSSSLAVAGKPPCWSGAKRQDTYRQEVRERGPGREDLQHVPTAREAVAHIARLAGAVHICKGEAQGPCPVR